MIESEARTVFAMPECGIFVPAASAGRHSVERFPSGEPHVRLRTDVAGAYRFAIESVAPPEERLAALLRLTHTLAEERAAPFVTHGLFTGYAWGELWPAGATRIHATDSVPGARRDGVGVLPVAGLLAQALLEPAEAAEKGRFVR